LPVNQEWYDALVDAAQFPRTQWTRRFFDEWAQWEGVPEWICNPLATTEPAPELRSSRDLGFGPGKWNNANPPYGVGIYKDQRSGGIATARTLRNGYYPVLIRAIENQDITNQNGTAANIRTWGTMGFAQKVQDGWEPVGATTPSPVVPPLPTGVEAVVRQVVDEIFPAYFRQMMVKYWVDNIGGDYSDAQGNPTPPDPDVVKAISEEVLGYWWGTVGNKP
jgi:hypothetical protein